jgi:hypothetical protein
VAVRAAGNGSFRGALRYPDGAEVRQDLEAVMARLMETGVIQLASR